jgi:hypothetical protein
MTEIEYEVREQDLIAFNEHQLQNSQKLQKSMRRHQATLPGIIAVIAMILFFYFKDLQSAVYVALIALGWGFGVPLYLKWNWRQQLRKMYSEEEKACVLGRCALRVEQDELVEITPSGESRMPWAEVLRIESTKKYAFVFVSADAALIIPRATLKKGDLHEFVKRADECIEQAA